MKEANTVSVFEFKHMVNMGDHTRAHLDDKQKPLREAVKTLSRLVCLHRYITVIGQLLAFFFFFLSGENMEKNTINHHFM